MINASIDLLQYLGEYQYADLIHKAVTKTLSVDQIHTNDIGGYSSSDEVVSSIKNNIRELLKSTEFKLF